MKRRLMNALGDLRRRLRKSGFSKLRMELSGDGELLEFSFRVQANSKLKIYENAYSGVLGILLEAGFRVGLEELALNVNGEVLDGAFLVKPLAEICP